ncbi:hypothetical protein NUITMVRE34_10580 [Enterococcus gallinarum]|nr:hypothetical protein NUITMVRE34_10580 [Enterococcus gallinarum]GMS50484.1 hypothetical protein NUITMVRE35_06190 [Enterococcus gallinarum]
MRKALAMLAALLITLGQGVPAVEALTVLENNAESAIVDSGSSISDESNESSEPSEDRTADSFETASSSQSMETEESIDESHSTESSSSSETTEKQVKVQVRLKVRHLPQVAVRRQRIQLRILQRLVCLLLPKGHQEPVIHQSQMIRQQIPPKVLRNQRHPTQVLQSANCRHPISL